MGNSLAQNFFQDADKVSFSRSLGIVPDPWQARVLRDPSKRICIAAARQTGKSTTSAILALRQATVFPNSVVLVTAPSQRQALLLFQRIAGLYKAQSIDNKIPSTDALKMKLELVNGSVIHALPGSERTVRGFTADMVIADEAARLPDDGAIVSALSPALSTRNGTLILISTPAGDIGFFRDAFFSGEWSSHLATVDDCPRITMEFLATERATMPERIFRQEFYCEWISAPGAVFTTAEVDAGFTDEVTPVLVPSKVLGPGFDPFNDRSTGT